MGRRRRRRRIPVLSRDCAMRCCSSHASVLDGWIVGAEGEREKVQYRGHVSTEAAARHRRMEMRGNELAQAYTRLRDMLSTTGSTTVYSMQGGLADCRKTEDGLDGSGMRKESRKDGEGEDACIGYSDVLKRGKETAQKNHTVAPSKQSGRARDRERTRKSQKWHGGEKSRKSVTITATSAASCSRRPAPSFCRWSGSRKAMKSSEPRT